MSANSKPVQAADQKALIDEIIRLSDYNFERLPMLDITGERFVENISIALADVTKVLCEASIDHLDYVPLAQVIDGLPEPAMIATCRASSFDGEFVLIYDSGLLLTYMELLLGGGAKSSVENGPQSFTGIERRFGARLTQTLLGELQASLSVVGDVDFELDAMETDPEAAAIAPQASLCVRMKLSVAMAGHTGTLLIAIPYDALEPIRHKLAKVHYGDSGSGDGGWHGILTEQLHKATAKLEVVVSEFQVPLDELMSMTPGEVVEIGTNESTPVTVNCEHTPMFRATTGQRNNGMVAVKVTELLDIEKG